ncbi:hypothetical protein QFC21_003222 [Naganishia friedmannii]|uniref:Uncharacterized protein n=1 Tax=Naganishia friedmannii TaxID=89922 RepID=A0ACC2VTV9_9TREE|nr:hypothetical protein QFC21_003222 [Naganishia friedmannii]
MPLVHPAIRLTDAQRTRRVFRYLALYALQTVKHLLLIAIASRQYLNLIHWLPVILSLQRSVFFHADDGNGRTREEDGTEDAYKLMHQPEGETNVTEQTYVSDTLMDNINTVLQATADLFLYWSYLKVPARLIIISSTLPYAFTLLAEILGLVQSRASYTITGPFRVFTTGVMTIFLTGIGLFWSEKQDSYAFLHLVVAICLKTIVMLPKEGSVVQHFLLRIFQKISSWITSRTSRMTGTLPRLVPPSYAPTICSFVTRIFHRFATPHFSATLILFLVDFLVQLPKRWSFFTSRCWGLAIALLVTDGLINVLEGCLRRDENDKPHNSHATVTENDDHFRNTIYRATEACMTSFLALLIASTSSTSIDITASHASSPLYVGNSDRNAKIVHFLLIILLCWLVVWVSTVLRSDSARGDDDVKHEAESEEAARRKVLGERKPKLFIAILGLLPLVLAIGEQTMSGTILGRIQDRCGQDDLRVDSSILSRNSDFAATRYPLPTLAKRGDDSRRPPDLPTMDVVIAYYNEPTPALRRLISGLRKELTWARVNVIIYHDGIPGFDDQLASRFNNELHSDVAGQDAAIREVMNIAEELKADIGADVVVPRKNVGRDMGVYLDHIFAHYGLFADPLDLLNAYPFPEMSIAWDLFHPETPLPKTPILTAYRGQMVISRDRIQKTEREAWEHTIRILVSERDDPIHVDGFGWKGEEEG